MNFYYIFNLYEGMYLKIILSNIIIFLDFIIHHIGNLLNFIIFKYILNFYFIITI